MTITQFSKTLAQNFQKYSIVPLIKEYIEEVEETNKSWRFNLNGKKDKKSMLKECKRRFGVFTSSQNVKRK